MKDIIGLSALGLMILGIAGLPVSYFWGVEGFIMACIGLGGAAVCVLIMELGKKRVRAAKESENKE